MVAGRTNLHLAATSCRNSGVSSSPSQPVPSGDVFGSETGARRSAPSTGFDSIAAPPLPSSRFPVRSARDRSADIVRTAAYFGQGHRYFVQRVRHTWVSCIERLTAGSPPGGGGGGGATGGPGPPQVNDVTH